MLKGFSAQEINRFKKFYYFWWGDTVGYEANTNGATWERSEEWRGVTWVSNQVERTGGSPFNNLCPTSSRAVSKLQEMGYIDSDLRLVAKHDAATVRLGAPWRMPTDVEFSNLVEKCDTVWTTSNGVTDWEEVSHAIIDAGEHRLVWAYLKDDADKDGDDCPRVACYSWAPDELWTHETEVAVPYSWLQEQFPEVIDDCDAYEALAQETAANGHKVWECFVAGLDAKDAESALRAFIELKDGKVCISWNPNLNTNEVTRIYRVWGRACLDQGGWATPPKSVDRFFKVEVTMPTGAAGEKSAVSGEGFEP